MRKEGSLVSPSLAPFSAKTKEIWKDIPNTSGIYQISNYGRVRSYTNRGPHSPGDVMRPHLDQKGYLIVRIRVNGKFTVKKLHRLVANAFVPNALNLPEINHKDENKTNARADNLEWCNRLYNIRYGTGMLRSNEKLPRKIVCQFDKDGNLIAEWPSVREAGRGLSMDSSCILRCAHRETYTYRGYIWLFKDSTTLKDDLSSAIDWLHQNERNFAYGKKTPIASFNDNGEIVCMYKSMRDAERETGFLCGEICKAIQKGVKRYGYYWKKVG